MKMDAAAHEEGPPSVPSSLFDIERLWLSVIKRVRATYAFRCLHFASDLALGVHDFVATIDIGQLPSTARDHLWLLAALALRPLVRTNGFLERRCLAKALRIAPPLYGIEARFVDTATVGEGTEKVVLRGTLWLPKGQPGPFPTIIIRSPYGAQSLHAEWGQMFLAERGYAVLFQDTRGRFGSDGDFLPVEHEKTDGAATVRWVRTQAWCDGRVGVYGPSYLGFTAWAAIGACAPGDLQVGVPSITQAVVRPAIFPENGAVALELLVLWFYLIEVVVLFGSPHRLAANLYRTWRDDRLRKAQMHAPLGNLDEWLVGKPWPFFQSGVREPGSDDSPFWASRSSLCEMRRGAAECVVPPPLHLVTGLHDFFARQCLIDYQRAAALQPDTRLTVAPYSHWDLASLGGYQVVIHAALASVEMHLPPGAPAIEPPRPPPPPPWDWRTPGRTAEDVCLPVQVCFLGSLRWRGYRTWPPPSGRTLTLWPSRTRAERRAAIADARRRRRRRRRRAQHDRIRLPAVAADVHRGRPVVQPSQRGRALAAVDRAAARRRRLQRRAARAAAVPRGHRHAPRAGVGRGALRRHRRAALPRHEPRRVPQPMRGAHARQRGGRRAERRRRTRRRPARHR